MIFFPVDDFLMLALGVDEFHIEINIHILAFIFDFTCRFRKSSSDVSGELSCHFSGMQQELESEEKEETWETCYRETNLRGETQWRS